MGLGFVLSISDSSCDDSAVPPGAEVGRICSDSLWSCALALGFGVALPANDEDLRS